MDQQTVTQALLKWLEEFVEQPHPGLGGWPPCPYARQARLSDNILIKPGTDPYYDSMSLLTYDWSREAVVFWYQSFDPKIFVTMVNNANEQLLPRNIVILEDHPDTEEITSGVRMNFGFCPIIVCQQLDKLNTASEQLKSKGYYDTWSDEDVDKIVSWRYHK